MKESAEKLKDTFLNKNLKLLLMFLLLGFIFLYFYRLGDFVLFNVDEPFYAEIGREIVESNDWIVPRFNYQTVFDKPIFFFWMEAISMKLFGINEFSVRFPTVLSSLLCSAFLFFVLQRFYNIFVGMLSALILMSSLMFIIYSRLAMLDMFLTSFITSSIISFFLAYNKALTSNDVPECKQNIWYLVGFIFLAFAVLTKGPVGIILVGMILFPFLWRIKKLSLVLSSSYFWFGFILFLALVLPWYIAVHYATNGEFTKVFFLHHNFSRFTSVVANHSGYFFFYIPVILIGFIPWSFFLPQSIYFFVKEDRKDLLQSSKKQFVWLALWWALVIFVFFTISRTKLVSYVMPLFPPLSILVAIGLWEMLNKEVNKKGIVYGFGLLTVPLILSSIIISAARLNSWILPKQIIESLTTIESYIDLNFVILLIILTTIGLTFSWLNSRRNTTVSILSLLTTFLLTYFSTVHYVLPMIDKNAGLQLELKAFTTNIKKDKAELITLNSSKPGFVFYSEKKIYTVKNKEQLIAKVMEKKKYAFVTDKDNFKKIPLNKIYICDWDIKDKYVFFTNYLLKKRSCASPF